MADKRYVFLSYGRKDVYEDKTNAVEQEAHFPIVEKVYRHLYGLRESTNLEPWFDKLCLTHDRHFTDSINLAIEHADYMLLFIGKHSMASEWCEREWKHALANCVPVIPILLEGSWGDADIQAAYPETIRYTDGINPQKADGTLDDNHLLTRIVSAIQQQPAPLAQAVGARKLPEHYIERKQYVDELKKQLGVNDKNYAQQKNIVGITSQQETAALQGIGGIGKTTLAQAICADCEVRRGFNQIFWLEVGPDKTITDLPALLRTIGTSFGDAAEHYDSLQNARVRVQNHLRGKRSLIVLDDVWAEGLVDQFSWAGVDCRLLVTTRSKNLVDHPQQIAKLGADEGLRLLATLFDPLNPKIDMLTADHRAIVTLLDGYTLAITIAGKWLMKYGQGRAAAYLARLKAGESDLFKQLDLSKSDKNANLELSLSLSYNDLEPDDQQRFRALGVFAAGSSFSLAALDAVWGTTDGFIEAQRLVDAGLLEAVKGAYDDDRYSQHSLLRSYARALLAKAGETDSLFGRYADYYIQLAQDFRQVPPEHWGYLDDDVPQIQAAGDELVIRIEAGQSDQWERGLAFASNITTYLARRREVRRVEWLEMGLKAARSLHQRGTGDQELYKRREVLFLSELGSVWSDLGEKRKALEYYDLALPLYRAVGDKRGEASTLNNIGSVWDALGEKRKALEYYDQALLLIQALGDKNGEATTLNNIGSVWDALGEKRMALDFFDQALPLLRAVGDKRGEASTLNNIGLVWDALGEKRKALDFYDQALPLLRAVGDKRGEATTLNNIGLVWDDLGEKRKALDFYDQALPLYRAVGDKRGEATTLNNIGSVWDALGEKRKALDFYDRALPLFRAVGDKRGEATTLNNIGRVWDALGEKRKALDFYDRALPILRAVGDKRGEATTLNNIGRVWDALGEKRKALDFYDRALPISRAVGDKRGEATTLNNIGRVWDALGEKRRALDFFDQALSISRAVSDKRGEATTLNNISYIFYRDGDLANSLEYLEQIVIIVKEIGDVSSEALFHANIAQVYKQLGDIKNAIAELSETVAILKHYKLPYDAGGGSVEEHEATVKQWERERDGLPAEDEQAQAWAAVVKLYTEQGEDAVRTALHEAGMADDVIEQVVAAIKSPSGGTPPSEA
jgi:tetratricopeptide (TPR) repeat protein